jgi:hypothetical protein
VHGDRGPGPSDDPLTAAGEIGRATPPPPLESDVSLSVTPKWRGWVVPVAVTVAVILNVGVGLLGFAPHRTSPEPATAPVPAMVPVIVPAGGPS